MNYRKQGKQKFLRHVISVPFIWAPLPFVILLDIVLETYHQVGFRLYGLPLIKRSEHIKVLDRAKLQYLNPVQKAGCMYCGYVNGFLRYAKVVAGETEKYWCGIMHKDIKPQEHIDAGFTKFNDSEEWNLKYALDSESFVTQNNSAANP